MRIHDHYELDFGQEDVVEVHRTDRTGAGGHPVYADDTGIVLAEISDRGEVRMLASGGHQDLPSSSRVRARPVQPH
ncbi:DUF6296 family protein [Streptomyces sp. NPDC049837]|uniref:DUF6296 family protein n=1 Tax=Streptomyces sp. NPDC049837 TaxID=3155277 RepID=UPI00341F57B5